MAEFNPDEFLKKTEPKNSDDFNPDSFLEKTRPKKSMLDSASSGLFDSLSLGYDDELAGALEAAGSTVGVRGLGGKLKDIHADAPTGFDFDKLKEIYKTKRDEARKEKVEAKEDNPKTYLGSNLVGSIGSSALLPGSAFGSIGRAAASGSALGAVNSLGSSDADNLKDLAIDTAMGGAIGAGAGAGGAMLEKGTKKLISNSKEYLTKGKDFIAGKYRNFKTETAPKIGELTSGIDRDVIKGYAKRQDLIDDLENSGVSDFAQKLVDKIDSTLGQAKSKAGKELENILENANTNVDVSNAKKAFQDRIAFLELKSHLTNAEQAEINALRNSYDKFFGLSNDILPTEKAILENSELKNLYSHLDTLIKNTPKKVKSEPADLTSDLVSMIRPTPKLTYDPSHDKFYSDLNNYFNKGIDAEFEFLNRESKELANAYDEIINTSNMKNSDEKIKYVLNQIKNLRNKILETDKVTELPDQISAGRAFDLQKKLKQAAAFETGMTPETLSVKGSARGAYSELNKSFDKATNGLSQDAKDNFSKIVGIENELGNNFDTAQKAYNTATGLNAKGKKMLAERLKKLSGDGLLDITDEIETLQAYNAFANPSLTPVGFRGATSTSRSVPLSVGMGGLGAMAGGAVAGPVGAGVGLTLGAGTGNLLGSPTMIKNIIKRGRILENKLDLKSNEAINNISQFLLKSPKMQLLLQNEPKTFLGIVNSFAEKIISNTNKIPIHADSEKPDFAKSIQSIEDRQNAFVTGN